MTSETTETTETSETTETRIGRAVARTDRQALTLTLLRAFDAPRERVFDAFASCEALARWWGPRDWTLPVCELDFRPGGSWLYAMRAPAGLIGPNGEDPWEAWGKMFYEKIDRPVSFSYRDTFVDPQGARISDMPEMTATMQFVDLGDGRTNLINTTRFSSVEDLQAMADMGMADGWAESFDKLDVILAEPAT